MKRHLTAEELDRLVDLARGFVTVLFDASEQSGHGPGELLGYDERGWPMFDDHNCVLCGDPIPCAGYNDVDEARNAIHRALLTLGAWEEVVRNPAYNRHSPLTQL